MIKVDIVNEVSKVADITKVKAEVAVDAVFDAMRLSMQRGERIELRGFGVFQVKPRKRGIGRNPRTGKEVRIPPGRTIRAYWLDEDPVAFHEDLAAKTPSFSMMDLSAVYDTTLVASFRTVPWNSDFDWFD